MEGESGNQRKTEEISGCEKRMRVMVEEAVETLISGMMGLRSGLTSMIEDSREELKTTDIKWQEYRDDIRIKHDYNLRQQEFLEKTDTMISKAMERWIIDTQRNMDKEQYKIRGTEVNIINAINALEAYGQRMQEYEVALKQGQNVQL